MKAHYIAREPALAIPFVALAVNVFVLLLIGTQLHSASSRLNLSLESNRQSPSAQVVLDEQGNTSLNGSTMGSLQELEFHLSAITGGAHSAAIQVPANIPSARLSEVLQACNRAGVTDVALKIMKRETPTAGK
ncbi:MAG: ExbD/TolR family protein [Candidatus Sumerlaeaceae bacterium]